MLKTILSWLRKFSPSSQNLEKCKIKEIYFNARILHHVIATKCVKIALFDHFYLKFFKIEI